jgi:hypothetical protein
MMGKTSIVHPLRWLIVLMMSLLWATVGSADALAERGDLEHCGIVAKTPLPDVHPSTPVGRTGSWTDTSAWNGNTVVANRELQLAGAKAGAPPINTPTSIGGRQYSGHALDRMQQRGYVPSVVEDAITNGTRTPSYGGASSYYRPVNNVTVIVDDASGRVVTVMGGGR